MPVPNCTPPPAPIVKLPVSTPPLNRLRKPLSTSTTPLLLNVTARLAVLPKNFVSVPMLLNTPVVAPNWPS